MSIAGTKGKYEHNRNTDRDEKLLARATLVPLLSLLVLLGNPGLWTPQGYDEPTAEAIDDDIETTEGSSIPAQSVATLGNSTLVDTRAGLLTTAEGPANDDTDSSGSTSASGDLSDSGSDEVVQDHSSSVRGIDSAAGDSLDGLSESDDAMRGGSGGSSNRAPFAVNQQVSTDEDVPVGFRLQANDPDGDELEFAIVNGPAHGTLVGFSKETGALQYVPELNYYGVDGFTFEVNDGRGNDDVATVSIVIKPSNDAPFVMNSTEAVTDEDAPVEINLSNSVVDPDGISSVITITILTQPLHGTAVLLKNTVVYIPESNYYGQDSFTFQATDGIFTSNTGKVIITVYPINDLPVAENVIVTTLEDTSTSITVVNGTSYDNDDPVPYTPTVNYTTAEDESIPVPFEQSAEAGSLPISLSNLTQPLHGSAILGENNTVTYIPDPNYNGPDSFTVSTISGNQSGLQLVLINVTSSNDEPLASNFTVTTMEETPILLTLVDGTNDADGDVSHLVITLPPSNGIIVISDDNKTVTYIPNENFEGTDSFVYLISDSVYNSTGMVNITVEAENDGLTIIEGPLDGISLNEDSSVDIDILSNVFDPDGDELTISNLTQPSNGFVLFNPDNTVTYTPNPGFNGQDSFTFTVTDVSGESIVGTVILTINLVNDVPLTHDGVNTLDEDQSLEIQLNSTDTDLDSLTYIIVSPSEHGTVTIVDSSAGIVEYTPFSNYFGSDSFTFQTTDGISSSTISKVQLIINSVNDEPVANDSNVVTDLEDPIVIEVIADDIDEDDVLTVDIEDQPDHGTAEVNDDGTITYTPDPDFNGTDSSDYTVTDNNGDSDSGTVTVTVGSENETPVIENSEVTLVEDQSIDIQLNATDADGDTLEFLLVIMPEHGSIEIISSNLVRYTPEENYYGTDIFAFIVSDGISDSTTATVQLTINSINDEPVANNESHMSEEDTTFEVNVLANDIDVDGDSLTVTLVEDSSTLQGSIVLEDGTFVYTPEENYYGTGSFQYEVSDGNGGSAIATVTITVISVNDPPISYEHLAYTIRNQPILIGLENEIDPDSSVYVGSLGTASEGSIRKSLDGKGVIYKPKPGFYGSDQFTYSITDGENSATVTVDVQVYKYNFWQEKQMLGILDDEFEQGSNVNIEFRLKDLTNHNEDPNLENPPVIIRMQHVDSNNVPIGPVMDATPSSGLYDGNQFNHYKSQYSYSMGTQDLAPGNWALYIYMLENFSTPSPEVLLETGSTDGITAIITIT